MIRFYIVTILFLSLFLTGCGPERSRESYDNPAPSANISHELAFSFARDTAFTIGGQVTTFTDTGSMLPWIDSRAVAVIERLDPHEKVYVGDIVGFTPKNGVFTAHRVVMVDPRTGLVATKGTGNARTDEGWHRPTYRLAAIYYTSREK